MKKLLIATAIALVALSAQAVETKKVCHDKVVKGKTVEQCKTIKVHKRFEGTKIADAEKDTIVKKPAKKSPAKKK